jgi:DNA-binding MarR family transcriptional regulator
LSRTIPVGHAAPHTGILMRRASDAFTAEIFRGVGARGFEDLRPAHAPVFQHIKEEGSRLTELAARAGMTPQSMGYLVDDLERLGYVERARDPSDRRASLIRPTDRGREEVSAAREVIAGLEASCARRIGKDRYRALIEDLTALADHLRRDEPTSVRS